MFSSGPSVGVYLTLDVFLRPTPVFCFRSSVGFHLILYPRRKSGSLGRSRFWKFIRRKFHQSMGVLSKCSREETKVHSSYLPNLNSILENLEKKVQITITIYPDQVDRVM